MAGIVRAPRPPRGWFEVQNATVRDNRLSYRARGVLLRILSNDDGWRCTSEDLAREGKEKRGAILTCFAELRGAGYMVTRKWQDARGRWNSETLVYDTPQEPEPTGVGKPDSGGPNAGQPDAGWPDPIKEDLPEGSAEKTTTTTTNRSSSNSLKPPTPTPTPTPAGKTPAPAATNPTPPCAGEMGPSDAESGGGAGEPVEVGLELEDNIKHLASEILPLLSNLDQATKQNLVDELSGGVAAARNPIQNPVGWMRRMVRQAKGEEPGGFTPALALDVQRARMKRQEATRLRQQAEAARAADEARLVEEGRTRAAAEGWESARDATFGALGMKAPAPPLS